MSALKATRRPVILASASVLLLLAVVMHWYQPGRVIAEIDLMPVWAPLTLLHKTGLAWSDFASPYGSLSFPTFSTYYLISYVFHALTNDGIAELAMFWLLMACAWLGVFFLGRSLGLRDWPSFFAAWAYVLSPYQQLQIAFITASAFAAVLPWVLFLLYEGATNASARRAITAASIALCMLLLPWVATTPQLFVELTLVAVAWAVFCGSRAAAGFPKWLLSIIAVCALASAWWLVPEFFAVFGNRISYVQQGGADWTFANSSFLNNLRFISVWSWGQRHFVPYSPEYDANLTTYAAGFFGSILLCVGLLLRRSSLTSFVRFFGALFAVALFVAKGLHPPFAAVDAFLYKLPLLFVLIEPTGLTIAAILGASIVLGVVFAEASTLQQPIRRYVVTCVLAAATAVSLLLAASPLLNGKIFARSADDAIKPYVSLPQYWRDAVAYIDSVPGPGAVLVLPPDTFYQVTYNWGYTGTDGIAGEMIRRPVLPLSPSLNYLANPALQSLIGDLYGALQFRAKHARERLSALGVRFILCRRDLQGSFLVDAQDCHVKFLARHATVRRFGKLLVYDLGPPVPSFVLDQPGTSVGLPDRTVLGFAHVVSVPAPSQHPAVLRERQFFNRTWAAFMTAPGLFPLAHVQSGWQNGWRVDRDGTVVVFNVVDALEVFFAAIGLIVLAAATTRAVKS